MGSAMDASAHFLGLFKSMSVAQQVLVEDGAEVEAGAPLVVLEAMKMEHAVRGSRAGFVRSSRQW